MIGSDIEYNHEVEEVIRSFWDRPDSPVKILGFIYYPWGTTDLRLEMTQAVGLKPDFIMSESFLEPEMVSGIAMAYELGYKGYYRVGMDWSDTYMTGLSNEAAEGVLCQTNYFPDPTVPENKVFVDAWQQAFGEVPSDKAMVSYSCVMILLKGIDKAGTATDLQEISKGVREAQWLWPAGGIVTFDAGGLVVFDKAVLRVIHNGKQELLEYLPMIPDDFKY